jgi:hypothetical protein
VALIESLEESKRVATDINDKVAQARETETAINDSRDKCAAGLWPGGSCLALAGIQHVVLLSCHSLSRPPANPVPIYVPMP